jgi:hypothetical protein
MTDGMLQNRAVCCEGLLTDMIKKNIVFRSMITFPHDFLWKAACSVLVWQQSVLSASQHDLSTKPPKCHTWLGSRLNEVVFG